MSDKFHDTTVDPFDPEDDDPLANPLYHRTIRPGLELNVGAGGSFIASLSWESLQTLRNAVRNVYLKGARERHLTPEKVDRLIMDLGPKVSGVLLQRAIESKIEFNHWREKQ